MRGRATARSLPALSEVVVEPLTAAFGALVCFVLPVVAVRALGFQLGTVGDVELVGGLLLVAVGWVVWSGPTGERG